jgi:predicted acyltransferase
MSTSKRILSVDIFRGVTIAAMILVNNPGTWASIYPPLEHAEWHGLTPTDLIFPFFLFIVGMSIAFAYTKKKAQGISSDVYKKIISRSLKLIVLGLILAGFTLDFPFFKNFSELRLPGVLQRIGVVFFISSLLFLHLNWRALLSVFLLILVGYFLIMTQLPMNGELPVLTRGSDWSAVIDMKVLTKAHTWKNNYDPEGILSTIPAIATTIMGMFLGMTILNKSKSHGDKLKFFIIIGVISLIIGYLWSLIFPLNKALWTSSYVLVTGGYASLIFAIIYYVADVLGHSSWGKPAIIFGSNAITVFFLSGIVGRIFEMIKLSNGLSIHENLYDVLSSVVTIPKLSSMLYAIFVIIFYYFVALFMYRKNIFIKV